MDESRQERQERTEEFAGRISLLLKHDWERAKLEAGFFPVWLGGKNRYVCRGTGVMSVAYEALAAESYDGAKKIESDGYACWF